MASRPNVASLYNCDDVNGTLELNGVELTNGLAWCCFNLDDLWKLDVRGDNILIPEQSGLMTAPIRLTQTTMSFPMLIAGGMDRFGVPYSDPAVGLEENRQYLREQLELPSQSNDSLVLARWQRPSGVILETEVQIIPPFRDATQPGYLRRIVVQVRAPHPFEVVGS